MEFEHLSSWHTGKRLVNISVHVV